MVDAKSKGFPKQLKKCEKIINSPQHNCNINKQKNLIPLLLLDYLCGVWCLVACVTFVDASSLMMMMMLHGGGGGVHFS